MDMIVLASLVGFSILMTFGAIFLMLLPTVVDFNETKQSLIGSLKRAFYPTTNRVNKRLALIIETPTNERHLSYIRNLSTSGALVEFDGSHLGVGTILKVKFLIGNNRRVLLNAHTVRKSRDSIGIQFDELDQHNKQVLEKYLMPQLKMQNRHLNQLA